MDLKSELKMESEPKMESRMSKMISYVRSSSVLKLMVFYGMWVILHYIAANLYPQICTPLTIRGFFESIFLTASPQCQGLRWIIQMGGSNISNMWLLIAGWIFLKLT
jgi:hypothetical protein